MLFDGSYLFSEEVENTQIQCLDFYVLFLCFIYFGWNPDSIVFSYF